MLFAWIQPEIFFLIFRCDSHKVGWKEVSICFGYDYSVRHGILHSNRERLVSTMCISAKTYNNSCSLAKQNEIYNTD